MKKIFRNLIIMLGLIVPLFGSIFYISNLSNYKLNNLEIYNNEKIIGKNNELLSGVEYWHSADKDEYFEYTLYHPIVSDDRMKSQLTLDIELFGHLRLDVKEIYYEGLQPGDSGNGIRRVFQNVNYYPVEVSSDGSILDDKPAPLWKFRTISAVALDGQYEGKEFGIGGESDWPNGKQPDYIDRDSGKIRLTLTQEYYEPIFPEAEKAQFISEISLTRVGERRSWYYEYDISFNEVITPDIIVSEFKIEPGDEGNTLYWDLYVPPGNEVEQVNFYYDGQEERIHDTLDINGEYLHSGGERGKVYKIEIINKWEPIVIEKTSPLPSIPPKLLSFDYNIYNYQITVKLLDENIKSIRSEEPHELIYYYGAWLGDDRGHNVNRDSNPFNIGIEEATRAPALPKISYNSDLDCLEITYIFNKDLSEDYKGKDVFFYFKDYETGYIWTTNYDYWDISGGKIDLNGNDPSVVVKEEPREAKVFVNTIEPKRKDNVDITVTNVIPESDHLYEDTVINNINVFGTSLTENNITVVSGDPKSNGTYKVNVSGLSKDTIYTDWYFTTETNAGTITTHIDSFTTKDVRPWLITFIVILILVIIALISVLVWWLLMSNKNKKDIKNNNKVMQA